MTETLHTRFYYGTAPCYPLRASTKKNVVVWVAFLPVLGLCGGPPWSQMGDMVCLDKDKVG